MSKALPSQLTSYDFIKAFALVIMIVDHIGYYFFPDVIWWRAVGRIGFPVWFFMAGHSSGRDMPSKLWGGALFLLGMNAVTGMALFPLNALFTIMFLRFGIDSVMKGAKLKPSYLWAVTVLCAVLFIPTNTVFEYGTLALMFAMLGYMVRRKGEGIFTPSLIQSYMLVITFFFVISQYFVFLLDTPQLIFTAVGTLIVCFTLANFRPVTYPGLAEKLTTPVTGVIQFCGRRTLEIYIIHLTLFKIAALVFHHQGYELFNLRLF